MCLYMMRRCNFHPEVLACGRAGINETECLNTAQIANLKRIYEPWWKINNTKIYDGLSPGGEAGYSFLFNGATPQFGKSPYLSESILIYIFDRNRFFQERHHQFIHLGLHNYKWVNNRTRRFHQPRKYLSAVLEICYLANAGSREELMLTTLT